MKRLHMCLPVAVVVVLLAFHASTAFAGILEAPPANISKNVGKAAGTPRSPATGSCGRAGRQRRRDLHLDAGDAAPTNISNNGHGRPGPQISGDRVVWQGYDGNDYEIYTWKLGDAHPPTSATEPA